MPTFNVTAPDGSNIPVNAPEGATEQQAIEFAAKTYQPQTKGWGETALQAGMNLPSSIGNQITGLGHVIMHPIDTANNLISLGAGTLQNVLPESVVNAVNSIDPNAAEGLKARQLADTVGHQYKQNYGSVEGFKNHLANDPAGVLSDASVVLSAGGSALSRIPSLAAPGEFLTKAGTAINPIYQTGRAVVAGSKLAGNGVANLIGGLGTHTGAESIKNAFAAGEAGGQDENTFQANLRQNVPASDIVDTAKDALNTMRADRSNAYQTGMAGVSSDPKILKMQPIKDAVQKAFDVNTYKGLSLSPDSAALQNKLNQAVEHWSSLNPAEYHTAEGMDALKKAVGNLRDGTQYGTPERVIANGVYNAVKNQITQQAPEYAKVMSGYQNASDQVNELQKAFSLGEKNTADNAMRKLQSLMRNNANTNYGNRLDQAKVLEQEGGASLMPALAGQSLNSWTPRGLGNLAAGGIGAAGLYLHNPLAIPLMAAQSPRLMGELSYYGGKAYGAGANTLEGVNKLSQLLGIDPAQAANLLSQANKANQ